LRSQRPDLAKAFAYLTDKNLSIFVSSWSDLQIAQAAEDLSEEEFMKL